MFTYRSSFLFGVIQQIYRIKQTQVSNLALNVKQLTTVDAITNHRQVHIRTLTISSFRPRAENQNFLDICMTAEHFL